MAYPRPTLNELLTRVRKDFKTYIPDTQPWLLGTFEYAAAWVLGFFAHAQHGHIEWAWRQIFPGTADDDIYWRIASFWGVSRLPATPWKGTYLFTGLDGALIVEGTELKSVAGARYVTQADVTIAAGEAEVEIWANLDYYGSDANLDDGAPLTLVSPVTDVDADGEVTSSLVDGANIETRAANYQRLLQRVRNPPSGGAPGDYVAWAREVPGITRAWEYPNADGPGTVVMAAVRDGETPITLDGAEATTMLDYIRTKAPVTVTLSERALTEQEVDFEIELTPDTPAIRTAVTNELLDMLTREGEPGGTITLGKINEAISAAAGEEDHVLVDPVASVTSTDTEIPVLGTITWS